MRNSNSRHAQPHVCDIMLRCAVTCETFENVSKYSQLRSGGLCIFVFVALHYFVSLHCIVLALRPTMLQYQSRLHNSVVLTRAIFDAGAMVRSTEHLRPHT